MERADALVETADAHGFAITDATGDVATDADLPTRLRLAYVTHAVAGLLPARRNALAKRALDLTLGLALLAVALPLIGALALAIRVGWLGRAVGDQAGAIGRAPVFARQQYAGRGGRVFVGASLPALQATRLRRLARLPLLLRVICGEMSLVGPRPTLYDEWVAQADPTSLHAQHALAKLYVIPGLTGPWLVSGQHALTPADDIHPLADPDLVYITHGSFVRDLMVLAQSPLALLRHRV